MLPAPSFAVPSVQTERSQSPVFCLRSDKEPRTHAAQSHPAAAAAAAHAAHAAPHADAAASARLPVALAAWECWTHPWCGDPWLVMPPCRCGAALHRLALPLSLSPSLGLNLILAAAKHLHRNLSDWRGAVSWRTSSPAQLHHWEGRERGGGGGGCVREQGAGQF